jgi:hypothetical protein
MTTYCGSKRPVPAGKTLGSPTICFRSGLRVGYAAASKNKETATRKAHHTGILQGSVAMMSDYKKRIASSALATLKRDVSLSNLKADELRSIVARLNTSGTTWPGPGSHTNASKQAMIQWLKTKGFHD